jgi:hypothetical protein
LIGTLFLLSVDFSSNPKPEVIVNITKAVSPSRDEFSPDSETSALKSVAPREKARNHQAKIQIIQVAVDSKLIHQSQNTIAEIPEVVDSTLIKIPELAKKPEKKPRYAISIETINLADDSPQTTYWARNRSGKLSKILTNTKMQLMRKTNGEPDRIILFGEENSYLCINFNN